jgi:hypothetical protein
VSRAQISVFRRFLSAFIDDRDMKPKSFIQDQADASRPGVFQGARVGKKGGLLEGNRAGQNLTAAQRKQAEKGRRSKGSEAQGRRTVLNQ